MMTVDARASRELRAVAYAMRDSERPVVNAMRREARAELNSSWRPALQAAPADRRQRRVLVAGARSDVGRGTFRLLAATRGRSLKGGLVPRDQWHGDEFGSNRLKQFRPRRKLGYVIYPTARKILPAAVAAYVRGAVRGLVEGAQQLDITRG